MAGDDGSELYELLAVGWPRDEEDGHEVVNSNCFVGAFLTRLPSRWTAGHAVGG